MARPKIDKRRRGASPSAMPPPKGLRVPMDDRSAAAEEAKRLNDAEPAAQATETSVLLSWIHRGAEGGA